jgi:pyruvate/2-oxoglutarate/acetoin dehydrogenase E1 component
MTASDAALEERTTQTKDLTYVLAVNAALDRALEQWPEVMLWGEDVADAGGIFGATRNLKKRHGDRVFDTPISESAILGSALGSSLYGVRPVVEIMWIDFTLVALDQIVNQIANVRYVSNGQATAPLVIRTQQGVLPGACAQHSQNLEALFAHTPGLRIGMPATAQDAYDMLLTAVASDDPTLIIENRSLYFGQRTPVTLGGPIAPLGGARVARGGSDLTIVTWSAMLGRAMEAAEALAAEGIDAEVIDLRWLNPLDTAAVAASVARTGKLLVAHEANVTGGFGAEIVARIAGQCWSSLTAAPVRVGTPDLRIPAAPHLQAAAIPGAGAVVRAARDLVGR